MTKTIDAVIVDNSHSPYGHLTPVPLTSVTLDSGFWHERLAINRRVTIPSQLVLLEQTGRLDNFQRASGESKKPFQGYVFNDSDVYKWLEAAAWSMTGQGESEIPKWIDQLITLVSKAQDKDGYINSYFSLEKIRERWMNLQEKHELYCAGHLIQAAIAHYRVTGSYRLLNVALRFADHICRTFGRAQVEGTCGHPEIEMALVELYRTTQETKYLDQAAVFIERRGRGLLGSSEYLLDHVPFRKLDRLTGHAVRALYLCCGATDLFMETGEDELKRSLDRLWTKMVTQQLYITGGVGARYDGEAFGFPYELPNSRAYAESCAAIANLMWNWRMLQIDGEARYTDLMEWTLYNAILPGVSSDGKEYFYVNPLKSDGSHRRETWFDCACCPPNIARTISSLPGYIYGVSSEGIWLHHYVESKATIKLITGENVTLEQVTSYPYDGQVELKIVSIESSQEHDEKPISNETFSFYIRQPGWLENENASIKINGKLYPHPTISGKYLEIQRRWKTGDRIDIYLPMTVKFIESHPLADENINRVAISRGPLLYCLESMDNPKLDLFEILLKPNLPVAAEYLPGLLGGMTRLHLHGFVQAIEHDWQQHLYRQYGRSGGHRRIRQVSLIAIPYFLWANRHPGQMQIWHLLR